MRPGEEEGQCDIWTDTTHDLLNDTLFRNSAGRRRYPPGYYICRPGRSRRVIDTGRWGVGVCPRDPRERETETETESEIFTLHASKVDRHLECSFTSCLALPCLRPGDVRVALPCQKKGAGERDGEH